MDATRIDAFAKLFAARRLSRRQALARGGAGLAAAGLAAAGLNSAAQARPALAEEAAPAAPDAEHGPTMLFVQSFQSGAIAPKEGDDGRYILTLEHGLGQTIYFSDRPDRIVGATPTPRFLEGLGFPADNPPNAALVVETADGATDLAVVELFDPRYDEATHTATYEAAVLQNWQNTVELGFTAAPTDLAALAPSFGAAHLFIDDCPDSEIQCVNPDLYSDDGFGQTVGTIANSVHNGFCYSWGSWTCLPCQPWIGDWSDALAHWRTECDTRFADCQGKCRAFGVCRPGWCIGQGDGATGE